MSDERWKQIKDEILARLNIQTECESAFGIQFKASHPSPTGWIPCLNPYKPEKNASAGINVSGSNGVRGYLVTFNNNNGIKKAIGFFDLARDWNPAVAGFSFKQIIQHYAKMTGVDITGKVNEPPDPKILEFYIKSLTKETLQHLYEYRGLNDLSVKKYEIGWSEKRERLTYPVYDKDGNLVNVRFHAWKNSQKPKTLNWVGYGQKRLWGVDRLVKAPEGATVTVTEGEWDSMLIEQETGLVSVSPTNGTESFDPDWVKNFHGKNVALVWDCDKPGRDSVKRNVLPAFRTAIRKGDVLSLKVVWLFEDESKEQKDFTDFIVKAGGSGPDLLRMIESAASIDFPLPNDALPEPIPLKSFTEIDNPIYAGKRVTVGLYIHGENSEAFHVPTAVEVLECPGRKKFGCSGRGDWDYSCDELIPVGMGDSVQLACVNNNRFQMKAHLTDYVCDKGQRPALKVSDEHKITLREVFAHQIVSGVSSSSSELVEKPVYTVGHEIYKIGQYQATGFIQTHPKHQKPTIVIDTMEKQEEDWESFRLTNESRQLLSDIQKLDVTTGEFTQELMYAVTRIYGRHDLHLGVLLSLCSPRWIDFPGEGTIRGWVSTVIIGDTGTGKSEVTEKLFKYADVGYRISGSTASRTGITYSIDYDERRGWRIKAGAHLKMSGQALIVDEAQDLEEVDLKTMAEALDSGRLKVDRIQNKTFEAETRVIFVCNPRDPKRASNQKTIASYQYGCMSLTRIFPKMMLRRLDLAIFAASFDIKDKGEVYNTTLPENYHPAILPKHLQALIFYAWNLQPEQIIISNTVARLIRKESSRLSNIFGQCEDIPLVYPEDFRKTFARLCASLAVMDLSSRDNFQTITVTDDHVYFMSEFLTLCYKNKNCQLDKYSTAYARENVLAEEDLIFDRLKAELDNNSDRYGYMSGILAEIVKLDPDGREKLSNVNIKDILEVELDRTTIFRLLRPWVDERLIKSSRGYLPTAKLFQFLHWLKETHPGFLEWGD
jgi:hypothetical protein